MRILLYLPTPGGLTGAPRRLLTLASALRENDFDVCIAGDANTELLSRAEELGFETVAVEPIGVLKLRGGALFGGGVIFRLRTGLALLRQNLRFRSKVRASGADLIWIRAGKGIAFAGPGALLSRRPLIWDVDYELPSKGIVRWLHRFGLWSSDAVVYQYAAAAEGIFGKKLADRYRYKSIASLPGIDISGLDLYRASRHRREKGIDDPFVILQVGTLCDRKNQLFLLEALGRLDITDLSRGVRVWLAGGLSDTEYVERVGCSVKGKGLSSVVELLGWRSDVHSLMTKADLLVMPSKDEGVPNTVQEAMYIGLPVLVSDAGGMPEVVEDGRTGWVVPLGKLEKWSYRLHQCIEGQAEAALIAEAASNYAAERFDMREWGEKYEGIIRRVARGEMVNKGET